MSILNKPAALTSIISLITSCAKVSIRRFLFAPAFFSMLILFFACNSRIETRRHHLDTTFFSGKNSAYEPQIRTEIMKTEAYNNFLKTSNEDSLLPYLKQAETEVFKKMNIKE